jgi:nitrous oxidase accessory protein
VNGAGRRKRTLAVAAVLVAAAVGAASVRAYGRSHDDLAGPPPPPADAGPVEASAPPGAFFADDEAALVRALGPGGPADIWLRARTYRGDFVVGRTLSLHGLRGAVLEGTRSGTVLTVTGDDAWIDNLHVRGSGRRHTTEDAGIRAKAARVRITRVSLDDALFGITLGPCPGCVVEDARVRGTEDDPELRGDGIKLWESPDAVVRRCVVEDSRDLVVWYSRHVLLEDNTIRRSRYGTHFMYAHDSIVRGSRLESNVVGVFFMYSNRMRIERNVLAGARGAAGVGVGFKESDGVEVEDNWIVANTTGTYLDRTPRSIDAPVVFEANVFALDDVALRLHSSEEGLTFRGNDFHQNAADVQVEGGGDALGVAFDGNHWTAYEGYDLDGDGVGDVAFEVKQLSSDLTGSRPALQLFDGTAAMGVIDAVARAVPVLAARRVLVDPRPSMAPRRPR